MRSLRGPGRLVPLSGRTRGSEDSRVNCPRGCKSCWVTSLRQTPCCCGPRTDGRPRGRPRSSRWGSWPTFPDLAASQAMCEAARLHHPRRQLSFSAFNQPAGDGWERVACLPSGSGGRGSFIQSVPDQGRRCCVAMPGARDLSSRIHLWAGRGGPRPPPTRRKGDGEPHDALRAKAGGGGGVADSRVSPGAWVAPRVGSGGPGAGRCWVCVAPITRPPGGCRQGCKVFEKLPTGGRWPPSPHLEWGPEAHLPAGRGGERDHAVARLGPERQQVRLQGCALRL